jgi:hypothetical protein
MSETMDICYSEQIPGGAKLEHLPNLAQPQEFGKETTFCSLFGRQSKIKDNGTENSFLWGFRERTSTRGRCVSIRKFGLVGADIAAGTLLQIRKTSIVSDLVGKVEHIRGYIYSCSCLHGTWSARTVDVESRVQTIIQQGYQLLFYSNLKSDTAAGGII